MTQENFIPYSKQNISDDDVKAVVAALISDYLTCGPRMDEFENKFAEYVGGKHAIVVCNATAALDLTMRAAGIGSGDRVITSPNTFLSSANCAAFVGATPDFCDIDPSTYNICPDALEKMWTDDIKAVVAVSFAGQSCDMPRIHKLAKSRGAVVIEDASHGTGGGFEIDGKAYKQGGHPWADMTVFSFHPVKTLTTGEGGIVITDNDEYAQSLRQLKTHGMTRDAEQFQGLGSDTPALTEKGPWYYEMTALGHNFRITDIQCALGLSQLSRLDQIIQRRQKIVAMYNSAFAELDFLETPKTLRPQDANHVSWHLYSVQINFENLGKTRTSVMTELRERNVGSQVLYIPVYLQPFYRNTYGYAAGKCPNSETYYSKALSLPLFPSMTDPDVQRVIAAIKNLNQ